MENNMEKMLIIWSGFIKVVAIALSEILQYLFLVYMGYILLSSLFGL